MEKSTPPFIIINLPRDRERLQYLQNALTARSFRYELIEAVDGRRLSELAGPEIVPVRPTGRFPRGILIKDQGLTMSHRKAALYLLARNFSHAVILEDDVDFRPDFVSLITELSKSPPADIIKFEGIGKKAFVLTHGTIVDRVLATTVPPTMGAAAYLLTRRAAKCIIDLTTTAWAPADYILAVAMRLVPSLHVLPYPVFQRPSVALDHAGRAEMDAQRVNVPLRAIRELHRYSYHFANLARLAQSGKLFTGRPKRMELQD